MYFHKGFPTQICKCRHARADKHTVNLSRSRRSNSCQYDENKGKENKAWNDSFHKKLML